MQHCVGFYCTAKRIGYTYTYIHSFKYYFPHVAHYRVLGEVAYAIVHTFTYFIFSAYISILISQFIDSLIFPCKYKFFSTSMTLKWAKDFNRYFLEEDIQKTNRNLKKKWGQNTSHQGNANPKTKMRYSFALTGIAVTNKSKQKQQK